jgi:hypothetical protein
MRVGEPVVEQSGEEGRFGVDTREVAGARILTVPGEIDLLGPSPARVGE